MTPAPRVLTLPQAPLYRDQFQPQSAMGVFLVGGDGATNEFAQAPRLIDFKSGLVIGFAEGDNAWQTATLEGEYREIALSATVPILFAIGADADLTNGPMLLNPAPHYFQIMTDPGASTVLHFRTVSPVGEGYLTVNRVTQPLNLPPE